MKKLISSLISNLRKYLVLAVSLIKREQTKKKMLENYNQYIFEKSYLLAQNIRDYVFSEENYGVKLPTNLTTLLKPQKWSLLHQFIFDTIKEWNQEIIRDCGGENELNVSYIKTLTTHKIGFSTETNYPKQEEYDDNRDYSVYLFNLIEGKCLRHISDEVFYLLFGDREFLKKFNELISDEISKLLVSNYPKILERDGVLKRPNSWQTWVKNAIRSRDKEECVFCGKDLTATKKSTNLPEIDHIVSINESGCNDITNLQYSCKDCNLEKSDTTKTNNLYIPYYKLE